MNQKQILQLLGLAHRSKNLVFGDTLIEKAKNGRVDLVIVTNDIGLASLRKIENACSSYQIPIIKLSSKEELAKSLGKKSISNVGVTNIGFKNKIMQLMEV